MRDATITDDGALEGRKKPKRKKKSNKTAVVTLVDALVHPSHESISPSKSFSNYSTTADSEYTDDEYIQKKKKKAKKCNRKPKKPKNTKDSLLEQENVKVNTAFTAGDFSNDSLLQDSLSQDDISHSSYMPVTDDSGLAGFSSADTSIVSGFYQKCKQFSYSLTSSDDEPASQPTCSRNSSHTVGSWPAKSREKKNKHKETCHKNKKFRPHSEKLRELLTQPPVLDERNNMAVFNNPINTNDMYQVSNINDVFVSSITAPEFEVELETTPHEPLIEQEEIPITETIDLEDPLGDVPEMTSSLQPNVTIEPQTAYGSYVIVNNEFKPVTHPVAPVARYEVVTIPSTNSPIVGTFNSVVKSTTKNYLMSTFTPAESASQYVQVPLRKNLTASISMVPKMVSIGDFVPTNSFVTSKPKTQVQQTPAMTKPRIASRSSTPANKQNCKCSLI